MERPGPAERRRPTDRNGATIAFGGQAGAGELEQVSTRRTLTPGGSSHPACEHVQTEAGVRCSGRPRGNHGRRGVETKSYIRTKS